MSDTDESKRGTLVRNAVVFQLKLMADGLRDLVLLPVSLVATVIGLLRGGDEPEREFLQVIEIGRESEQWINLFGNHDAGDDSHAIASIDALFTTESTDSRCSFGFLIFSLKRLNTFSTSITASSTKAPIAMAIPPKLIVFMVYPNTFKMITVTNNDIGIARSEIMVVLQFIRNMNNTIITKNAPSNSV